MKILFIFLILFYNSLFGDETAWVDKQIEAIKPLREGLNLQQVEKLKDPFIYLNQTTKEKKISNKIVKKTTPSIVRKTLTSYQSFHLQAIMNSTALIDGKWYKNGSYVYGYKLLIQNRTEVILKNKTQRLVLSTKKKIKTLKLH